MFNSGSRARECTLGVSMHRIAADKHLLEAFLGSARVLPGAPQKAALLAALPARDRARFLTYVRARTHAPPLPSHLPQCLGQAVRSHQDAIFSH